MLYNVFKYGIFVWAVRLLFRPQIEGAENIPRRGPAILVSNHISAGDTFLVPALLRRRLTFPAKLELFHGRGLKGRLLGWFLRAVGQVPMDRSGGRASAGSMDSVLQVLRDGGLLGIYPEGTRSPDGRLYKGKTGVARLVLQAGVPVIPLAVIGTEFVPSSHPQGADHETAAGPDRQRRWTSPRTPTPATTARCCAGSPTRSWTR